MFAIITRRTIRLLIALCGLVVWSGCAHKIAKASYQHRTSAIARDSQVPTRALEDAINVRIVAANLTSGNEQSYSLDNENHSNEEGAGARILKGLKPDVILIQEFNTGIATQQWVTQTFGPDYEFAKESGAGIPNGIVSRFPIVAEGEWDDPTQSNRDFAWAKIRLPNGRNLWAVSVHLKAGGDRDIRQKQAEELVRRIRANIPAQDYVVLGGDFNTSSRTEPCIAELGQVFQTAGPHPEDQRGDPDTNKNRRKPYDWVLADAELDPHLTATQLGETSFASGLVVDTRVFEPIDAIAPAQEGDSDTPNMQHMAVVKDFTIPWRSTSFFRPIIGHVVCGIRTVGSLKQKN
jgi:endonuclease/exonuclease/phosphatase family metal-dependent hydrolase